MPDGISVNFDDLFKLSADLGKVAPNAGHKIAGAVEVTAREIKDAWRGKLSGAASLPGAARSVTYDLGSTGQSLIREAFNSGSFGLANAVVAEIGPVLGGQGSLVGVVEYGSPTLAPRGYGAAALQESESKFADRLSEAARQAELELGIS